MSRLKIGKGWHDRQELYLSLQYTNPIRIQIYNTYPDNSGVLISFDNTDESGQFNIDARDLSIFSGWMDKLYTALSECKNDIEGQIAFIKFHKEHS